MVGDMGQAVAIDDVRLPQVDESAKQALAKCTQVDECRDWADKSMALAAYAKQSKEE